MALLLVYCLGLLVFLGPIAAQTAPEGAAGSSLACAAPEARQFDFWLGEWNVVNRWLTDTGKWVAAGQATNKVHSVLDGCAVIEHWEGNIGRTRLYGFSIRAYDPAKKEWVLVLNWPRKDKPHFLTLEGEFHHGRGEFSFTSTNQEGREVLNRYTFSDISRERLRWDQATSDDGGQHWRTGWIMEFSRRDPDTELPLLNGPARTHSLCGQPEARRFDFLAGEWEGSYRVRESDGSWRETPARDRAFVLLEGCAVIDFLEVKDGAPSYKRVRIRALDPEKKLWVQYSINNHRPVFVSLEGNWEDGRAVLSTAAAEAESETLRRVTWSDVTDESVRWQTEESTDGGRSWHSTEEAVLTRKK